MESSVLTLKMCISVEEGAEGSMVSQPHQTQTQAMAVCSIFRWAWPRRAFLSSLVQGG